MSASGPLPPASLEPVLDWSAIAPGRTFAPVAFTLDDASVDAYLAATGETHPLYARDGAGLAPPTYSMLVRFVKASLGGRWPDGTLQLDHRIAMRRALRRGERLTIDARIVRVDDDGARRHFELASSVRDADGEVVVEQSSAQRWAGAAAPPTAAPAGAPPPAPARAPRPPPGDAPPAGPHLGPLVATYGLDALRAYGALAGALDPIHVDPDYGRGTRYGGNIVQGRLAMTLPARLMLERHGRAWLERGELRMRFVRAVMAGERVEARAAPLDADARRCTVWCENPRGERVIEGSASIDAGDG